MAVSECIHHYESKTSQHASTLYSNPPMTQQQRRASQTSSNGSSAAPPIAPPINNIPQAPPMPPSSGIAQINTSGAPPPPPLPPVGVGAPPPQQQQHHQQYIQQFITQQPTKQPPAPVQQRVAPPAPSQQAVYRQGNAQATAASPRPVYPQGNVHQVVHYYNDGQQIVQQIIPKVIAANGNLPLSGPFQSHSVAAVDPAEYEKRQEILRQAYQQPQTRSAEAQGNVRVQPSARVQPRIYESTVTATGHRQAHAIRTYQATKSVSVTPPNSQPAAATRSSGRVSAAKKRYSGHVLPGPTIDHRSLLEKRTTSKPRYVRVP